jgi:hypothetical protein
LLLLQLRFYCCSCQKNTIELTWVLKVAAKWRGLQRKS